MKRWRITGVAGLILVAGCQTAEVEGNPSEGNGQQEQEVADENGNDNEEKPEQDDSIEENASQEEEVPDEEEVAQEPTYRVNDTVWTIEPIDDADPEIVLATFDDAPDAYTLDIAKTLKEHEVPAIFFVNGHFLSSDEEKDMLREIHNMGFEIGNHTMTHQDLKSISEEEQYNEIVELNDMIEDVTGERPRFFRAPFGSNTDYSRQIVNEEEMVLMNWTYGYDWESEYQNAEGLAEIMTTTEFLQNGANLLMHDREWTSEALPGIIKGLRDQSYEFVDPALIESSQNE